MTKFRPCIDLHLGKVKQIVGRTLSNEKNLKINFTSNSSAANFARLYAKDNLKGGHIISLGPGNTKSIKEALKAFPNGLQVGGGITKETAKMWIDAKASHVIITSWMFDDSGNLDYSKLKELKKLLGKDRIVIDLSCKKTSQGWVVMRKYWQEETKLILNKKVFDVLSEYCSEFLVHATDVEGTCSGIDMGLIKFLAKNSSIKVTYAGGVSSLHELDAIRDLSNGNIDATIGSALDIFGGKLVRYKDCLNWNNFNG